jgi:hypothetical protein
MNIDLQNLPSPSKLITTMDKHPVGACLFLLALSILSLAAALFGGLWFLLR